MAAEVTSGTAPVGRLAPSPTGAQHIGNARTYLIAWLSVRSAGGQVVLRIEDIDSPRVKSWATEQAITDLRWLGLDWDAGPDVGGPHAPYVQTQRLPKYQEAFSRLQQQEWVYPCFCSRSDVLAAASAPHAGGEGPVYPGTCASRAVSDAALADAASFSWRFRTSRVTQQFEDRVAGQISGNVQAELGDFVIAKSEGSPAYQLAVVVDDFCMGITEVVRGDDLLPSTLRQLDLLHRFDWTPPEYAHLPLVVGADGRRLAKRHGDTRLDCLRADGGRPERLVGLLAWSVGLIEKIEAVSAAELLSEFAWSKIVRRDPFVFDKSQWWSWLTGGEL